LRDDQELGSQALIVGEIGGFKTFGSGQPILLFLLLGHWRSPAGYKLATDRQCL